MGQKTHFVIVAEDKTKKIGKVTVLYNHWGIGRVMPIALMSLIGNIKGYDKWYSKDFLKHASVDYERLGFEKECELRYKNGVAVSTKNKVKNFSDWKNPAIAGEYMRQFDNNNGCMFVFVTYDFSEETYTEKIKKEIAWMIGWEDARHIENAKYGQAFSKWLSTRQWMSIDINNHWWGKDPEFKELFNRFLAYFEVKPLTPPKKAKNAA